MILNARRLIFTASLGLLIVMPSFVKAQSKKSDVPTKRPFSLTLEQREYFQILKFHGGFNKENPYKKHIQKIRKLIPQKDILLIINRGYGGSVKDHKRFARDLQSKCQGSCKIVTYLDGQCSSMCTTLFLLGDVRLARKGPSANLAFHRTLIRIGTRSIPIQSVRGMVRYFSKFEGVNSNYLENNKNKLFKTKGNALSKVYGEELTKAGFVTELFDSNRGNLNELFLHLGVN